MRKLLLILLFLFSLSFAHAPRIVEESITIIENPEISQAFYGELNGSPAYFRIESDEPFLLYVGILVPAIEGVQKDKSVEVASDGENVLFLNASSSDWPYYYEEFGGDGYFDGPSDDRQVPAGTYIVRVSSPENTGKYTFVVGKKEEFSLSDALLLPRLKGEFFGKSPFEALFGFVGISMVVLAFLVVLVGHATLRILRRK